MRLGSSRQPAYLGCAIAAALVAADARPATAKLLEARVLQAGEVRLRAEFGVPDTAPPAEMWQRLDGLEFRAAGPLGDDPAAAEVTLDGVRVVVAWVGRTEAEAEVGRLRVVRVAESADRWRLAGDEVARAGRAAGLDPGSDASGVVGWWIWAGVAAVAALGGAAWLIVWLSRRPRHPPRDG
ncbi:MAG TPA: hypothetical protein VD866_06570 [Urbifossiella sp.]|nr:hypothetical protein [Urbifossiella sp.]